MTLKHLALALLVLGLAGGLLGQQAPAPQPVRPGAATQVAATAPAPAQGAQEGPSIHDLIGQLGGKDFAARQQAKEQLRKIGALALPALRAAAAGSDPEIAAQAAEILAGWQWLRLPKASVQTVFGDPFLRVSPKGDRLAYVRLAADGSGLGKLSIYEFGPPAREQPMGAGAPMSAVDWNRGFTGRCWRADGMQLAFVAADAKDGHENEPVRDRIGLAIFWWDDVPFPQQTGGGNQNEYPLSCTGLTYAPAGKDLWHAQSDLKAYTISRIIGPAGEVHHLAGAAIQALTCSDDGKCLAWVERRPLGKLPGGPRDEAAARAKAQALAVLDKAGAAPPPAQPPPGSAVVVMDLATRKLVHRVPVASAPGQLVWADGGRVLVFADVPKIGTISRREVKVLDLASGQIRPVLRDAKPVGACGTLLVANQGPACEPMEQLGSSFAPPRATDDRPRKDQIVLLDLAAETLRPTVLVVGAFAQQVLGNDLFFTEESGQDVIIFKVPLKRP